MKIAIPTNDKLTISQHFGRAKGFMICETDNNKVISKEYKANTFTGHGKGHHHHSHNAQHHNHSHAGIFNALGDCKTVIAGGMGQRLYNEFVNKKINVFVSSEKNIDKALELFFNNMLDNDSESCCNH